MKHITRIQILLLLSVLISCIRADNKMIIPGQSIGNISIGQVISAERSGEYREKLKDEGVQITLEKGTSISSISTVSETYKTESGLSVGMGIAETVQILGKPVFLDGEPYNNSDLSDLSKGFLAYSGLLLWMNEGKIVVISVVRDESQ